MTSSSVESILGLASRNHGAISRHQLLLAGISSSTIDRKIRSGLLVPFTAGVYLAPLVSSPLADLAAGILTSPGSAIAQFSAARLHGFKVLENTRHLVGQHGATPRPPGVRFHQTRSLPSFHLEEFEGLPITTPARTLVDLAGVLGPARLRFIVERQLSEGVPSADDLVACHLHLARRGRRGTVALRALLNELLDDQEFPQSRLELAVLTTLNKSGIHMFRQARLPWYDGVRGIVDFADPVGRTILEADGRTFHNTSEAFYSDRRRDRLAAAHGWVVMRVGWRDVVGTGRGPMDEVIDVIRHRRLIAA